MRVFAIDPGPGKSAFVVYDSEQHEIIDKGILGNQLIRGELFSNTDEVVIEMIASYGMPVGKEVFETCVWIGRFMECALEGSESVSRITRNEVKNEICHSSKAKDSNIRQALIDMFPKTGLDGKNNPSGIGTKKHQGPLYGVSADMWAALAVAIAWSNTTTR